MTALTPEQNAEGAKLSAEYAAASAKVDWSMLGEAGKIARYALEQTAKLEAAMKALAHSPLPCGVEFKSAACPQCGGEVKVPFLVPSPAPAPAKTADEAAWKEGAASAKRLLEYMGSQERVFFYRSDILDVCRVLEGLPPVPRPVSDAEIDQRVTDLADALEVNRLADWPGIIREALAKSPVTTTKD
ncbi:MAG TPA: hypothetical protein VMQ76_07720 [Terracidiphilus sp.]|nr:hypothetical protein [Terracidiphilus sp.]